MRRLLAFRKPRFESNATAAVKQTHEKKQARIAAQKYNFPTPDGHDSPVSREVARRHLHSTTNLYKYNLAVPSRDFPNLIPPH